MSFKESSEVSPEIVPQPKPVRKVMRSNKKAKRPKMRKQTFSS